MTQREPHEFDYDVCVIGAGPGGYVAAIRAAQLGLKVACIDKRETLGGTCLNVGCIPSKALLHASYNFNQIKSGHLKHLGIDVSDVSLNLEQMQKDKRKTVEDLTKGISFLFKKNKIDHIIGGAAFIGPHVLSVGEQTISSNNIVIATGSTPSELSEIELNGDIVFDSTGALSLSEVPSHLVVVGGGVIGLELGSVWKRLGAKVTVIEFQEHILGDMDSAICNEALKVYKKQGINFELNCRVTAVTNNKNGVSISYQSNANDEPSIIDASHMLIATGRTPNTENLELSKIGLELNNRGLIESDHRFHTSVKGVWAIGDVIPGPMLAHRAEDEGIAVAENIAGLTGMVNHKVIPSVVYTHPEIASVGMTETEANMQTNTNVGLFPFQANSRAKASHETDGFVKVIADKETDEVLGVHIIGAQAGNMIAQAVQAMEFGATSEDIAYTCHAHPTHSEALKEAAMSILGSPIHK